MGISQALAARGDQRHWIRWTLPGQQSRLSVYILGLFLGFVVFSGVNSYIAYGALFSAALSDAPEVFGNDIVAQTRNYMGVSGALLLGYTLAVIGVCAAYVRRLVGPNVALERHVRRLKAGDYSARVSVRAGDTGHASLANELNELAMQLERDSA